MYKRKRGVCHYRNNGDEDEEYGNELDKNAFVKCEDNHIYFYGDVNTQNNLVLNLFIRQLNTLLLNTKADINHRFSCDANLCIYLHINSVGGSVFDSLGSVDTIINSKIPIVSIIEGCAASAATFLSIVCNKRQITKHSSMLIHQLSSSSWGTYEQIKDEYDNCTYLHKTIVKLYMEHSNGKLDEKKLNKCLKRDIWWDADKCKKLGLVDEIV